MSLYNVLRTGVSGMEAQSYKLATVSDNIANANTVGYKRADTEFSSLILEAGPGNYSSGAVTASVQYEVSRQGALSYTLSKTDLAVQGDGFFVVQDANGGDFLTRAGSFVVDGQSGNLVNAAGFSLLGVASRDGEEPAFPLNTTNNLEPVNIDVMDMDANQSTAGVYRTNVDSTVPVVTGNTPSANAADSAFSFKTSMVAFNNEGAEVTLDVYWTKTQDYDPVGPTPAQWEVTIFDQSTANTLPGTDFPYGLPEAPDGATAAPTQAWLANATVEFDPSTGVISSIDGVEPSPPHPQLTATDFDPVTVDPADPNAQAILQVSIPGATDPLALNITNSTQLAADFEPLEISVNGNAPARIQDVLISEDGRVFGQYEDGTEVEFYRLPLANVPSPDQLDPRPGNVYDPTVQSGDLRIALPNDSGNGSLVVGAVEQSNVDLATELTEMIISQRAYTANSRSFQAGSELLEVLVNLSR